MKVKELLEKKSRPVHTIAGDQSVARAVDIMSGRRTSALIVTENEQPIGIFTERDLFRIYQRDKTTVKSETPMKDILTGNLITANPDDHVGSLVARMVNADIKHLPVMKENSIIGMLTLHDLVDQYVESLTDEIHNLKDYIEDLHEAGRD
jgi:IMP dehydrogenase